MTASTGAMSPRPIAVSVFLRVLLPRGPAPAAVRFAAKTRLPRFRASVVRSVPLAALAGLLLVLAGVASPISGAWGNTVSAWQGWRRVGGPAAGTPGLVFDVDRGWLDVVAPAADGFARHYRPDGETWSAVAALDAHSTLTPALAVDAEGAVHMAVTASDGKVYQNRFIDGRWEGFVDTGSASAAPPVLAYNAFARAVELIIVAPDGSLMHNRFLDGRWGAWTPVGSSALGTPALGTNFQDTAFDLIYSALDGALLHRRFTGTWGPETGLQGTTRLRPALAVGPTGSLEVAITGADGAVAHDRRVAGRWLGWQSLGFHSALAPALIYNTDADTLELAAVGTDGQVAHNRYLNGAWTRWWPLGAATLAAPALVQGAGSDLEMVVAGADGDLWHNRFAPRAAGLVSFANDIQSLFDTYCTSCHEGPRPPMGLNLGAGQSYGLTVNAGSREARKLRRIQPGDPDGSYLFRKITNTHTSAGGSGTPMPPGDTLSAGEIARIRDWIAQGALLN
jgi:hypothetical protein